MHCADRGTWPAQGRGSAPRASNGRRVTLRGVVLREGCNHGDFHGEGFSVCGGGELLLRGGLHGTDSGGRRQCGSGDQLWASKEAPTSTLALEGVLNDLWSILSLCTLLPRCP